MKTFSNITWPEGAVYNVTSEEGAKIQGGADIEHHYSIEGCKNTWIERMKEQIKQDLINYVEHAQDRVCNS